MIKVLKIFQNSLELEALASNKMRLKPSFPNVTRTLLLILLLNGTSHAKEEREDVYTRNCIPCHLYLPSSLERMFMNYLKTYSGEQTFKSSLKVFLKDPTEEESLMSDMFIEHFSVKDKSTLSDEELEKAIDIYWDTYNVRNKLR